jgi:hypothetical protein
MERRDATRNDCPCAPELVEGRSSQVEDGLTEHRMMLRNLAALVGNYLAVGVRFFVHSPGRYPGRTLARPVRHKVSQCQRPTMPHKMTSRLDSLAAGGTSAIDFPVTT